MKNGAEGNCSSLAICLSNTRAWSAPGKATPGRDAQEVALHPSLSDAGSLTPHAICSSIYPVLLTFWHKPLRRSPPITFPGTMHGCDEITQPRVAEGRITQKTTWCVMSGTCRQSRTLQCPCPTPIHGRGSNFWGTLSQR